MPWLDQIAATVTSEFSDLRDVAEITRVALRLAVAAVLGAILGFERESKGKAAGVRTHMLVAIGSALFVLIPQQAGVADNDLTRVMQGVIAGIGFLGAGAILKRNEDRPDRSSADGRDAEKGRTRDEGALEHDAGREGRDISGLTTAASIWMTAAIGMAAGYGREATATVSALLALATLMLAPYLIDRFGVDRKRRGGSDP